MSVEAGILGRSLVKIIILGDYFQIMVMLGLVSLFSTS